MVVSVPVMLVAYFTHRLSGALGVQPLIYWHSTRIAAGCNFYVSVRMGLWYGHGTWWNTGLLSFAEGFSRLFGRWLLLFFLCKSLTNASVAFANITVIFWCKAGKV